MKESKNQLMQFVGGIVLLGVGLFILSMRVDVFSTWGIGWSLGGFHISSGLVMIPFIIGVVWMFATDSFASKVFTAASVLLIVVAIILTTNIRLETMKLYEWVVILILIFGGIGLVAKTLLADRAASADKSGGEVKSQKEKSDKGADDELEELKKNLHR